MPGLADQTHFNIELAEAILLIRGLLTHRASGMNEIAAVTVDAEQIVFEASAFFGFVLGVILIVFPEFSESVSKFASLVIGTETILHELFAEL